MRNTERPCKHDQRHIAVKISGIILCGLLFLACPVSAQKAYKSIKTALKAKKYSDAISQIDKLRKDSDYTNDAQLYLLAIEANRGLNDAQNMKLYLKQNYDTTAFFTTTYQIVKNAVKIDSIENKNKEKAAANNKLTRIVSETIHQYMPNIHAAGRYFYKKKKYKEALPYLRFCLELPHTAIGQRAKLPTHKDTLNAVLYLCSAYNIGDYAETKRYAALALLETTARPTIIEDLALTAKAERDTATYRRWLTEGWTSYPNTPLFFTHLVDFYNENKQYDNTIRTAERQLLADSLHTAAYMAKCVAYYEMQAYDSCIINADHILLSDSTNADATYYKGASYVGKVKQIVMPEKITSPQYKQALNKRQKLYSQAEPELERFRTLSPDAIQLWGPLLYQTYYALNRGKKFAEIESLLEKYSQSTHK